MVRIWNPKPYQGLFYWDTLHFCTLNQPFIPACFCIIMHWPLGNYWFAEFCCSSRFRYQKWLYQCALWLILPPTSSGKSVTIGKQSSSWGYTLSFPKFRFLPQRLNLLAIKTLNCCSWNDSFTEFIFEKMCDHTYPSLKSQSIRLVTWHSTQKRPLVQLLHTGIWASPRRQTWLFGMQLKCSMHVSHFVINSITKAHTRGSKRNRLNHCSLLYQGLSSVKWALLFPAASAP